MVNIEKQKLVELYNKSNVFVSTSIAETFGLAQCEAMMCGVPVVATSNGGIDDFISKENGIKVPLRDFHAVAESILKIKDGSISFDRHKIRESVKRKYGKQVFKKKLEDLCTLTLKS